MKRAVRASGDGAPPPDDPSGAEDVQLMLRAARDDMEAFGLLVEKHQKSLLNFFARCGVERDVEDLAQLTFLKLHRIRRAYRPAAKFTTFLFLIAKQTMLDRVRSDARKAALHERAGREAEPVPPSGAAETARTRSAEPAASGDASAPASPIRAAAKAAKRRMCSRIGAKCSTLRARNPAISACRRPGDLREAQTAC